VSDCVIPERKRPHGRRTAVRHHQRFGEVAQNTSGVAHSAQNTSQGVTDSQKAAHHLASMSTQLRQVVQHFKLESNGHVMPLNAITEAKSCDHEDMPVGAD
jgi:hypothetical protein